MTIINLSEYDDDMERLEVIVERLEEISLDIDTTPSYCAFEIGRLCSEIEEWRLVLTREGDEVE